MKSPTIGESIDIDGLRLVCTCSISPEQYDVFLENEQIGYLRLRHGDFTAADTGGELVYEATPAGDCCFEDEERVHFLTEAVQALKSRACMGGMG
jgi:hypothetical protein